MDAKEKAIAACESCLISRNIGRVFKIGWCTNVIREDGVGSTVYEDGFMFGRIPVMAILIVLAGSGRIVLILMVSRTLFIRS